MSVQKPDYKIIRTIYKLSNYPETDQENYGPFLKPDFNPANK